MEKILIVDDSKINREMLRVIFEEQYDIVEACDGEEAIRILDEMNEELKIVFLDFVMPKVSGIEVLRYIRYSSYADSIPVIMVTGEANSEVEEMAFDYGVSDVIYKPLVPRTILRRTRNIVELFENRKQLESQLKEKSNPKNEIFLDALCTAITFRTSEMGEREQLTQRLIEILLNCFMKNCPEYGLTEDDMNVISRACALRVQGEEKDLEYCNEQAEKITSLWEEFLLISDIFEVFLSSSEDENAVEKAIEEIESGNCGLFSSDVLDCLMDVKEECISLLK
ncbi:MAG: response regulator [Agathobacter sp.]|nr:response regulator [Agathobacter sp.]